MIYVLVINKINIYLATFFNIVTTVGFFMQGLFIL